ncbi:MAG TPA: hypothetical protein VID26_13065 [Candidatus Limnocylindrales bacterium]
MTQPGTPIPRSQVSVGLDPDLRRALGELAAGRVLVVDYFASRGCSVVIGDLTCDLRPVPPGTGFAELAPIEGVRLFVETRLLPVIRDAGASLRLAGPSFARHLAVDLELPDRWIEFLEEPGILAGKQLLRSGFGGRDREGAG